MPPAAELLELYRCLYLVRSAEEAIQARYHEDEMKTPVHLSIGQEAIPVGVCAALSPNDRIYATYRNHAVYLARTGDLAGFFAELYGRGTGAAGGKAGSMHLSAPDRGLLATSAVVGTTIPLALGSALAARRRGTGARVAAFFGDGALDEGVFWESLNFACLHRLPVLFVCEDNGLAIHSRDDQRHGYDSIADVVDRFRCHVVRSDTTDAAEIRGLAADALRRCDAGSGPVFLHLRCYRYVEHVGPEIDRAFDLPHRRRAEFEAWRGRDPLDVLRGRALEAGIAAEDLAQLQHEVALRVAGAVETARRDPFPPRAALFEDVLA